MVIHTFGGYYGLAISWMLYRPNLDQSSNLQGSVYHSDVFAMIGASGLVPTSSLYFPFLFPLWACLWPPRSLSAQVPSSCGCSGPVSTQPSQTTETASTERPSTPTWPWPQPCSPRWPSQASSRSTESWTW